MPKTRTASERDVLRDEFIACHMELLVHKNDVMEAEAGQSHKAAIDTMQASLVSSFMEFLVYSLISRFVSARRL